MYKLKDSLIKPITYAYRMLFPAEKNNSVIEKKSLVIVFAPKKFHRFLHGRRNTLQTDHRPLLAILGLKKAYPPIELIGCSEKESSY